MRWLPQDPLGLVEPAPFRPAGRRTCALFGAAVELLWLPERRERSGRPGPDRSPFPPSVAERILASESVWQHGGFALTPNRHPFAERQLLLWPTAPRREPDAEMLEVGARLAAAADGTLLVNSIGAAASIPWAHAHLLGERLPFLDNLPLERIRLPLAGSDDVDVLRADAPFPAALVALRGDFRARARTAARLLRLRASTAFNVVDSAGTTWIFPRSCETPAPHFPQALGSAELWGRWCYDDEDAFGSATPERLAAALQVAGCAPHAL